MLTGTLSPQGGSALGVAPHSNMTPRRTITAHQPAACAAIRWQRVVTLTWSREASSLSTVLQQRAGCQSRRATARPRLPTPRAACAGHVQTPTQPRLHRIPRLAQQGLSLTAARAASLHPLQSSAASLSPAAMTHCLICRAASRTSATPRGVWCSGSMRQTWTPAMQSAAWYKPALTQTPTRQETKPSTVGPTSSTIRAATPRWHPHVASAASRCRLVLTQIRLQPKLRRTSATLKRDCSTTSMPAPSRTPRIACAASPLRGRRALTQTQTILAT